MQCVYCVVVGSTTTTVVSLMGCWCDKSNTHCLFKKQAWIFGAVEGVVAQSEAECRGILFYFFYLTGGLNVIVGNLLLLCAFIAQTLDVLHPLNSVELHCTIYTSAEREGNFVPGSYEKLYDAEQFLHSEQHHIITEARIITSRNSFTGENTDSWMILLLCSPQSRVEPYILVSEMKRIPQHDYFYTRKHLCILMMYDSYAVMCIHGWLSQERGRYNVM